MSRHQVMHQDRHFIILTCHRYQAEVGCQHILAFYLIIIVTIRTGVIPFVVIIITPVEITIIIIVSSIIETRTFLFEFDFIFSKQLFAGDFHGIVAGIGRQIFIERKFDTVNGTGFRFHHLLHIDSIGVPLGKIAAVFIQEDRLTCNQAAHTHQVRSPVQIIHLEELADILLQYLYHTYHNATKINGLERHKQLSGLRYNNSLPDKPDIRQKAADLDLAGNIFFQSKAVLTAYLMVQMYIHNSRTLSIGI